jgi:hypothetical protein
MLNSAFVCILLNSGDPFASKLLLELLLTVEKQKKDESIVVLASISSCQLRQPSSVASPKGALLAANSEPLNQTPVKSTLLPPS